MRLPVATQRFAAALFLAALAVPLSTQSVRAAQDDNDDYADSPAARVGRVSRLDGEASLRQSGGDWEDVADNAPIFEGDEFYTSDNSRMELQLGGGRYLRLDGRTDVVFAYLDEHSVRVDVPTGTVIVSVRDIDHDESIQLSAPAAAVTIREPGVYRLDVDDDGNTRLGVSEGRARVSGTTRTVDVEEGESARIAYDYPDDVDIAGYRGMYDHFDSWSADLDKRYEDSYARSSQYVGSISGRNDIYGLSELADYGSWYNSAEYGWCWQPNGGYGWSPYSNGYWDYYPGYGYTWISSDPWGWAPYHYGRWGFVNGRWAWVPWSQYTGGYGYAWAPSQVYWYQYPGYSGYSYVPLAPNEPYIDYRHFDKRHQRDFVPQNLRAGRGIGLVQPGSGARLRPVVGSRPVKGTDFGGRTPVAVNPRQPADATPVKPKFTPVIATPVRTRPVVIDTTAGAVVNRPGRGPAVESRPTRQAAGDRGAVVVKPGRQPAASGNPTMVQDGARPGRQPANGGGISTPIDANGTGTVVVAPRRPSNDGNNSNGGDDSGRPKPRRAEPVGPTGPVGPATVDRQPRNNGNNDDRPRVDRNNNDDRPKVDRNNDDRPKVDRNNNDDRPKVDRNNNNDRPTVDRAPRQDSAPRQDAPRRADPPPQRNDPPARVERQAPPERSSPPPQRADPPARSEPAHVDRAPANNGGGGGGRNKPNR